MVPLRHTGAAPVVLALALASASLPAVLLSGCKSKPNAADEADAGAATRAADPAPPLPFDDDGDGGSGGPVGDGGNRFRDAGPNVVVDPDGPVDPACTGMEVAFAIAVVSTRCAIGSGRAKQLRAALESDAGSITLRQEAKRGDDGRVTLRMVNSGLVSLTLPLSYSAKLPAFTVLAEDERHAIFELDAPKLDVAGSTASKDRPHFARIVLPPGGAAVATIAIETGVVKRLGRGAGDAGAGDAGGDKCDGGPCTPTKLTKGRYVLHVGQLLADVEAGAPARVTWDLP